MQLTRDPLVEVTLVEAPLAIYPDGRKDACARGPSQVGTLHQPIHHVVGGEEDVVHEALSRGHGVASTVVPWSDCGNKANGRARLSRRLYEPLLLRGQDELQAAVHAELVVDVVQVDLDRAL